jgi:hypothetical protein
LLPLHPAEIWRRHPRHCDDWEPAASYWLA